MEDVVFVGGDDEFLGGESHALCEVAGEDVAEVAGGDDEAYFGGGEEAGLADEVEVGVEVVGDLGEDAGPVDGVDGCELVRAVDLGVGEEGFDKVLGRGLVVGGDGLVSGVPGSRRRCRLRRGCGHWHP